MTKQTPSFRRTTLARTVLAVCSASAAVISWPAAMAQTAPALQRVEVTGSNIKRVDAEKATSVQVLTREDIEKAGKSSVAELLQSLAVDNQGSVPISFSNGFAKGGAGISLRGLGASSTLVLINGRRVAPYGTADDGQKVFTDLNIIPAEAVDRIEVLKDGASAIYGSDAIAGVVNIILRKNYVGTTAKASVGQSRYGDGTDTKVSITHGFGDLATDEYNVLFNLELGKVGAIFNRDRAGRGSVGVTDGRPFGYDVFHAFGGGAVAGAITGNNAAGGTFNGSVRNPTTLDYYNRGNLAGVGFTRVFPAANCANFSRSPQGGDKGGCLADPAQLYGQIAPDQKTTNFFGRASKQINADLLGYVELNLYQSKSYSVSTPSGISGSVGFPGGPVSNAAVALGAAHPDNPYFGQTARFRYTAADVGPRTNDSKSDFIRLVTGLKGTYADWDYDTAFLYSENKGTNTLNGYLQRDVEFALLNPSAANVAAARARSAAYAALPAGTFWRIGENAGLNSAALYGALSPSLSQNSVTKTTQLDFKASRELGQMPGGPIGLAVGAEVRRESNRLTPTTGTEIGNIIGLGYSAYDGARNVAGVYSEALFPITKTFEASAAVRADHYSDSGNSFTPKVGAKWTPATNFAVRGSYAAGFRAPSPAENGKGGLAFFSSATDPVRCGLGVPGQFGAAPGQGCTTNTVAGITSPNPALEPEKSKSISAGVVWEPAAGSSLSIDLFQIKRTNEINQETTASAIAGGRVSRDPSTITNTPGDPGAITAVLTGYINSASTTVRGLDFDGRQIVDLPSGYGKLIFDAKWTHLFKFQRTEKDGTTFDFAGTHGNCDTSNCAGTPADKVNLAATWEMGQLRIATLVNYRGKLKNTYFKNDPDGCASVFANGNDAPNGCTLGSFTTVDLNARYKVTPKTEIYGGIRNLFDKIPPTDPLTYGASGYNPTDYSGAVGRYFNVGIRQQF